jgi:hypothetical protein
MHFPSSRMTGTEKAARIELPTAACFAEENKGSVSMSDTIQSLRSWTARPQHWSPMATNPQSFT